MIKQLFIEKLHIVAHGHRSQHNFRLAEAAFKLILWLDSTDRNATYWLGDCRLRSGDAESAIELFAGLTEFTSTNVEFCIKMAESYLEAQRFEEALDWGRRALDLDAVHVEANSTLGTIHQHMGDFDEAVRWFLRVLELDPSSSSACLAIGRIEFDRGLRPEAVRWFERAAEISPDSPDVYDSLSEAKYYTDFGHDHIQHIEDLIGRGQLPPTELMSLHFTLGDICNHLGRWDEAFSHYTRGNSIAARLAPVKFSRSGLRRMYRQRKKVFSESLINRLGHSQRVHTGKSLIFIVGMPRSGTTLVEQILASHPAVHGGGERPDIPNLIRALASEEGLGEDYPGCLRSLDPKTADVLASRYVDVVTLLAKGSLRFVDKLPSNFWELGLIRSIFPHAKIVHCTRDPLDTCLSCFMQNFKYLQFSRNIENAAYYYREYTKIMQLWQHIGIAGIHEVRYENVVDNPEVAVRSLLEFCELPWDDRCLAFHKTSRHVTTASWGQVKSPLYSISVGRWRNYTKFLGPAIRALGASSSSRSARITHRS